MAADRAAQRREFFLRSAPGVGGQVAAEAQGAGHGDAARAEEVVAQAGQFSLGGRLAAGVVALTAKGGEFFGHGSGLGAERVFGSGEVGGGGIWVAGQFGPGRFIERRGE